MRTWLGGLVAVGALAWLAWWSWQAVAGIAALVLGLGIWSSGRERARRRRLRDREPENWAQVAESLTVGSELPVADAWDLVGNYQRRYPGVDPDKAYEYMRRDGF